MAGGSRLEVLGVYSGSDEVCYSPYESKTERSTGTMVPRPYGLKLTYSLGAL